MKNRIILESLFEIFLMISLIFIISISNAAVVSAEDAQQDSRVCCQKAKIGDETKYCQYTERSNCDISDGGLVFDNKCEDVSICKPSCCNVNSLGYTATGGQGCFKSVSLDTCKNELNGIPIADPQCSVPDCGMGCCVVGSQCALTTEQSCRNLTNTYPDLEFNFKNEVSDELQCQDVCRAEKRGCCVTTADGSSQDKGCNMITFSECSALSGEFHEGINCVDLSEQVNVDDCKHCEYENNPKLSCAPELDGGEDVWEYDKCDNPVKVSKDCKYGEGTICREENNTASCKSLNCDLENLWDNPFVDENGDCFVCDASGACKLKEGADSKCWINDNKTMGNKYNGRDYRINGESWCEYDADAGPTRDLPGTRHYVHACVNGEEDVVECADYRDEFCIQVNTDEMTVAKCVPNRATTNLCSSCTDEHCCKNSGSVDCVWIPFNTDKMVEDIRKTEEAACERIKEANSSNTCPASQAEDVASGAEKGKCIPIVPPGTKDNPAFCDAADIGNLTSYWSHGPFGDAWDCDAGCVIYTNKFAYEQNKLCKAQGDCGADFNLAGEWSDLGFTRSCDLVELKDSDLEGVKNTSDYNIEEYSGGDAADELIAECKPYLPDPGSYSPKAESFLNSAFYKNSLLVNDIGQFSASGYDAWDYAMFTTGAVGAVIVAALLISAKLAAWAGPYGWIAAVVLIAIAALIKFTSGSTEETVAIDCKPWSPPIGSENCHLCHEAGTRTYILPSETTQSENVDFTAGGKHDCTDYLCWSLGQGCKYTETNEGPKCLDDCKLETSVPKVNMSANFSNYNKNKCGLGNDANSQTVDCPVSNSGTGSAIRYVKANSDLVVAIHTNELATCKWDWGIKTKYDDLEKGFDQSLAATEHTITLEADVDLKPEDKKTMYIICKDTCDNPKSGASSYPIEIEVGKIRDIGAPMFTSIEPSDGSPVKNNLVGNKTEAILKLNEEADCRFSKTNDLYDLMNITNQFHCGKPARGCGFDLNDVQLGTNTYYIRCKDKTNNTNVDALPTNSGYRIIRSDPLNITSVRCMHSFGDNCTEIYDNNFTLEVTTFGGGYAGRATCKYNGVDFFNTNLSISTQIIRGDNQQIIKCADDVGNEAETVVNYTMKSDSEPPQILKVSLEQGNLNLLTSEIATCSYYGNSSVLFENMTLFSNTGNLVHSTSLNNMNYVHVKCKDRFDKITNVDVYKG